MWSAVSNLLPMLALAAACCGVLGACSSSGTEPGTFLESPLVVVTSTGGSLQLAVFSVSQPPVHGIVPIRYAITDSSGQPVDGLSLAVDPWMPAMKHGTSVTPAVTARGSGIYDLDNLYLYMAGQWQLRTAISEGADDDAAPSFMVQ